MNAIVKLGPKAPIFLCGEPTDMRLGLPGLAAKIEKAERDPKKQGLYVFVSKNFRRVKIFYWDRNGYAMWYKHVEKAVFRIEFKDGYRQITGVNLGALLKGTAKKRVTQNGKS